MTTIAFLGLGAMGVRMAHRLLDAGHTVTVWNRTPGRSAALEAAGARAADTPAAAVRGADLALSMVRDDEASRRVWLNTDDGALAALSDRAVAVECSTLSVPWVRELAAAAYARGIALVDAPLAGSRPQAEAGQLIFFAGGLASAVDRARPVLEPMAAAVHHVGDSGAGATVKLMVNALFGAQLAALAELLGFAERAGVDRAAAVEAIGATPVCSPAARLSAAAMLAGNFAPAFPIDLVAKDFALLDASAQALSATVPVSNATGRVYSAGVEQGLGDDNITGIVQRYSASE